METRDPNVPQARSEGLVMQELPDELLVYDLDRHRSHCLNRTAALVWRHCDGKTTVGEMATLLHEELDLPQDEAVVWSALDRLGKAHLLQERLIPPADPASYSRRALMRRLGIVALLVPLVETITAPAAHAVTSCLANNGCSGKPNGTVCKNNGGQCAFVCCNNVCQSSCP